MNERIWFFFQVNTKKQTGPLTLSELLDSKTKGELNLNDFVFRQGFDNWKPLKDVPELMSAIPPPPQVPSKTLRPARALLQETIVAHNDALIVTGRLSNISENGVFLETDQLIFQEGEILKITIKEGKDLGKPINIRGKIIRKKQDRPLGYGIELMDVDSIVKKRIAVYIDRQKK
jgi:hypothetical protein